MLRSRVLWSIAQLLLAAAVVEAPRGVQPEQPPPIGELRAVWVHASSTHTPAECEALLDKVQSTHLNCIYWLGFYWGGQCFFRNPFVPLPSTVERGFDPLAYLIREGHKRGIEVHVRFVNGENGSSEAGPIFGAHRDWEWVDSTGKQRLWYDFANPEVRAFEKELMLSAIRNYLDLDGIQFDFIRFEDGAGSFSQAARKGFAEATGIVWKDGDNTSLPLVTGFRGNPVGGVTTAQVRAHFSDGTPAITTNKIGGGNVLLLNWHAEQGPSPFVPSLVRKGLEARGVRSGSVPLLHVPESDQWHAKYREPAQALLQKAGYKPRWVEPDAIPSSPVGVPVLVVPNAYRIPHSTLERLAGYARSGGHMIVIDGPIHAIEDSLCQELLGLSKECPYLSGLDAILPDGEFALFTVAQPVSADDAAKYRDLGAKWTHYQASCITSLVESVYDGAHALKPSVTVSACTFHRRASAESLLQYWHDWVRDGIVDRACTMAYTPDNDSLRKSMYEWVATDPKHERIVPGLGVYDIDGDGEPQRPDQVLPQMRICREEGGFTGIVFFHLPEMTDALRSALVAGPFATVVPRGPLFWPTPRS